MLSKAQVKYIQSFADKKFRDVEHAFIAEGPKIVGEFLEERPDDVLSIFADPDWTAHPGISSKQKVHVLEPGDLERISFLASPNKVLAVIRKPVIPEKEDLTKGYTLLLDDIQDPGNLGTIIRTADWFGVRNIFCSHHTADAYNPKVVQSTMSSISRVRLRYVDLAEFIAEHSGIPVWAASLQGDDIRDMLPTDPLMLLIGNESRGISTGLMELCTHRVTIPRIGKAESLNASVATGILLSHLS